MIYNAANIKSEIAAAKEYMAKKVLYAVQKTYISGVDKKVNRIYLKNEVMAAFIEEASYYNIGKSMQEDIMLENIISCLKKMRLK